MIDPDDTLRDGNFVWSTDLDADDSSRLRVGHELARALAIVVAPFVEPDVGLS